MEQESVEILKCKCGSVLEKCKGTYPYSEDYLICPFCESTYCCEI